MKEKKETDTTKMRSWKRKSDAVSPTTSGTSHAHSSTTSEDDNSLAGDDELHQIEDVQSAVEELLKGESAVELLKKATTDKYTHQHEDPTERKESNLRSWKRKSSARLSSASQTDLPSPTDKKH